MRIFDRIILALYTFLVTIVSIIAIIIPFDFFDWLNYEVISDYISTIKGNYWISIIGLAFLIGSLRVLLSGIRRKDKVNYITKATKHGELKISTDTIKGLSNTVTSKIDGVKDIDTDVYLLQDSIMIKIKGKVTPDINIPEETISIQEKVKKHIQNCTGIDVCEVKVEISNISTSNNAIK